MSKNIHNNKVLLNLVKISSTPIKVGLWYTVCLLKEGQGLVIKTGKSMEKDL